MTNDFRGKRTQECLTLVCWLTEFGYTFAMSNHHESTSPSSRITCLWRLNAFGSQKYRRNQGGGDTKKGKLDQQG
eukprot:CAMPEP_0185743194 /NCGR_PEP_ID=MMETSP1174-20130828/827_1 /TAXON_ID=35687 /ORGANISM="Dictyocha speculum, Strain CCMP1381" /LENGTH=74 /DNA_ID=CAMNT_0028415687 /DNA_START=782 /DNA_END=1006 /DNA_ORIENTATION=-